MIKSNGGTYQSSKFGKVTAVSEPKTGKSSYLVAGVLGVLPWQSKGGIVDTPEHLNVFTFDAGALDGIRRFLLETCKAPEAALNFTVYNLEDDIRKLYANDVDYDMSLYNTVLSAVTSALEDVRKKPGVHACLFSSLTGLAKGLERGVNGPPKTSASGKVGVSDQSKWQVIAAKLTEIQNWVQQDVWHSFWEGHIDKAPTMGADTAKESIQVSGKAGRSWAFNTPQVFRIRRQMGSTHPGTKCDLIYLDTRPNLEFIAGGRSFTEALDPKEYDPAEAFRKLKLVTGDWNKK